MADDLVAATSVELRHLRYFVALAEELHFGRAAERVFVAQSTLSGQIRTLEERMDVRLFERTKRSVALTEAGRTLLPYARRLLREAARAEEATRHVEQGLAGILRVSYETGVVHGYLSRIIKAFRQRAPGVRLELFDRSSRAQADALRAGEVDVGFLFLPADERALMTWEIGVLPSVVVMPEHHRLAGRKHVALAELADEEHVMWARELVPAAYDEYLHACHNAGFHPRVVQEVRNQESLLGLVAAGMGVAVAHRLVAELRPPGVRFAPLTEPPLTLRTGVAWSHEGTSPVLTRFLEVVREVAVLPEPPI